jgi:hypothetical protein
MFSIGNVFAFDEGKTATEDGSDIALVITLSASWFPLAINTGIPERSRRANSRLKNNPIEVSFQSPS